MASSSNKSFTSLIYWCVVIGGIVLVFLAVKTVYTWGNGPDTQTEVSVVQSQDDVVSLEKDLGALSKTTVDDDLAELEKMGL